jgi:hypothetical protein
MRLQVKDFIKLVQYGEKAKYQPKTDEEIKEFLKELKGELKELKRK